MFEKNVGRKNMKVVDRLNFSNREALPKIILNISVGPGIALNTRLSIISLIISKYYIITMLSSADKTLNTLYLASLLGSPQPITLPRLT